MGLISALFPSADGALTALTASTCIDLIGIRERGWDESKQIRVRKLVHSGIAVLFFFLVMWFYYNRSDKIIDTLYGLAAITYGPLLGLFAFGIISRAQTTEPLVPIVCIGAAIATYLLRQNSAELFFGYKMGFETLIINGLLTFVGLWITSKRPPDAPT